MKTHLCDQRIFFDEMGYEDTGAGARDQADLNRYGGSRLPVDSRHPGAKTPGCYFAADATVVIVIHEGDTWPQEPQLQGDSHQAIHQHSRIGRRPHRSGVRATPRTSQSSNRVGAMRGLSPGFRPRSSSAAPK